MDRFYGVFARAGSMSSIRIASSAEEIRNCYSVMVQLRPHLSEAEFVAQVQRQQKDTGYTLAYVESNNRVQACAGFRVAEYLAWGKAMYVDDLIADEQTRGKGY